MTKNCTLCAFAMKPSGANLNPPLQCWRFPPQMVVIPIPPRPLVNGGGNARVQIVPMRPVVTAQITCYEFTPVEVANDKEATA